MPRVAYGEISRHARDRMRERGLSEGDLEWIMADARYDRPGSEHPNRVYSRYDARNRATYYVVLGTNAAVVSTFWRPDRR